MTSPDVLVLGAGLAGLSAARDLARGGAMRGRHAHCLFEILGYVGFVEQPEPALEGERAQDLAIDFPGPHQAGGYGLLELREVHAVFHVHGHGALAQ